MPAPCPVQGWKSKDKASLLVDMVAGEELTQPRLPAVTAGMWGWGSLKAPSLHQGQAKARGRFGCGFLVKWERQERFPFEGSRPRADAADCFAEGFAPGFLERQALPGLELGSDQNLLEGP